jgi:hypothetical protein
MSSRDSKQQKQKDKNQDTQPRENSNSEEESLENFISQQEKETEDINFNEEKSEGISGLDPEEISALLTTTLAQNVPENKRQQFANSYQPTVYQILLFIDFEDLTKGANVKELPGWIRGLIALGSIGIFSVFTLKQFKEVDYKEKVNENDKKEEWRE